MNLDELSLEVYDTAVSKGFWNSGSRDSEIYGTKLALIHSEVTEVLEAIRKDKGPDQVVEEMADIIIRVLDLYAGMRKQGDVCDSLEDMVQLKVDKNKLRPILHGAKF